MQLYGQSEPPDYNLSAISARVYLISGRNDWFSSLIDVAKLRQNLKAKAKLIIVEDPMWNHFDFLFGIDAYKYVYSRIISTINFKENG